MVPVGKTAVFAGKCPTCLSLACGAKLSAVWWCLCHWQQRCAARGAIHSYTLYYQFFFAHCQLCTLWFLLCDEKTMRCDARRAACRASYCGYLL